MVNIQNLTITIFGGTGFIGRHLVKQLCDKDCRIQIITRNQAKAYFLQPLGDVGQIVSLPCNFTNTSDLRKAIRKADIVINLIGILYEKRKSDFENTHFNITKKIVDVCNEYKNKNLIHFSAIGVEQNKRSLYASSKLKAEQYILNNLKNFSIIRPSVIFGEEDKFFNLFARISSFSPFLPLVMGGKTRFQPVHVEDVCRGVVKILESESKKRIYEFVGPGIYSFRELMQILLKVINRKRFLLYIPKPIAILLAKILELFPSPLITQDQIKLLEYDNIASKKYATFKDINIIPASPELIMHEYLKRFIKKKSSF